MIGINGRQAPPPLPFNHHFSLIIFHPTLQPWHPYALTDACHPDRTLLITFDSSPIIQHHECCIPYLTKALGKDPPFRIFPSDWRSVRFSSSYRVALRLSLDVQFEIRGHPFHGRHVPRLSMSSPTGDQRQSVVSTCLFRCPCFMIFMNSTL